MTNHATIKPWGESDGCMLQHPESPRKQRMLNFEC